MVNWILHVSDKKKGIHEYKFYEKLDARTAMDLIVEFGSDDINNLYIKKNE